jgi:uncharacterized protein YggE
MALAQRPAAAFSGNPKMRADDQSKRFASCFIIADQTGLVQHLTMKRSLFFVLLIFPISAFADGGLPDKPYIYIEGQTETTQPADIVTLSFELVFRAADQAKANEQVQAGATKVFGVLKESKITDTDIIAEGIRTGPEFEQSTPSSYSYSSGRGKLIGYFASRPFEVRVHDVPAFPKLVEKLLAIDGVEFSAIRGSLSKLKELEDQLWDKALADARQRAEKTLKPMGMKIDSVFAVSPVSFPEIQGSFFRSPERVVVTGSAVPTLEESGLPKFRLAPITVSQMVHVIYLISPAK